jgi:vitamin B12 transporter
MMTLALGMWGQAFAEDSTATYELAPIVVTANRVPEKLVDTKADISVVTRKQIENLHLQTVEDTLREVPGTQFLNYGSNGLNANLSGIRINGSKDVVILIDGVRITDFQGANNSGY